MARGGAIVPGIPVSPNERAEMLHSFEDRDLVPCTSLLDSLSHQLPKHVCRDVIRKGVSKYASAWFPPQNGTWERWLHEWPLPVGERSMAQYAEKHRVSKRSLPPALPKVDCNMRVAVWIERVASAGTVTLWGPGELGLAPEQPDLLTVYDPVVVCAYLDGPPTKTDPMHQIAQDLSTWYQQTVLYESTERRGRPRGPVRDVSKILRVFEEVCSDFRKGGMASPSDQRITDFVDGVLKEQYSDGFPSGIRRSVLGADLKRAGFNTRQGFYAAWEDQQKK